MLDATEAVEHDKIVDIATALVCELNDCLVSGDSHKLSSSAQASLWSAFHQFRCSQQIKETWSNFIGKQLPEPCQEPQLTLQLLD